MIALGLELNKIVKEYSLLRQDLELVLIYLGTPGEVMFFQTYSFEVI